MPHPKAFRAGGAGAVVPISTLVVAGAMLLASPARGFLGSLAAPIARRLSTSLGLVSPPIDVVSDSHSVVVAIAGARAVVAGRILDAEGAPVAGSAVRVLSEARPDWDWVTSSGSDGSFRVEGVAAGKVRVAAQDVEAGFVESALLEANEARNVVLVLDRIIEVAGVVLDERGAPVARAAVKSTGKAGALERVVLADEDGRFALRGAARSLDRLSVWARGFEATTFAVGDASSIATRRSVRLRAARPLQGFVVDPAGEGVSGARVSACAGKDAETTTSDASGAFRLPATVIGCSVTAQHPRFAGSRTIRIGDRRELVLRLGAGGAIEGTAVDEHGRPIGLFSVTIASFEAEEGAPGVPTRAGEAAEHLRGVFRLDDLAPGTYVLQLRANGRVDAQSRPIEVGRGKVIRGQQLVLTAAEDDDAPVTGEEPTPAQREATTESAESHATAATESGETKGDAVGTASESEPPERSE